MKTFTIERDDDTDLRFEGELLGEASSTDERQRSDFSGETGRWQELNLYGTKAGAFVCQRIGHTRWMGDRGTHEAEVCNSHAEVLEFFGTDWLAKELYADVQDFEAVEVIE